MDTERYANVMHKLLKKMFEEVEENTKARAEYAEMEISKDFILEEEFENWFEDAIYSQKGAFIHLYEWMKSEKYGLPLDKNNMFKEFEDVRH
ncbi:MAG: hypothetical protein IJ077_08645 [Eubacterium sp.]|nr:hypothetical protein [Alphaproteobacteria bacterium]MBQ8981661.1 hypothetical protein [Eubacterium sp.]